MAAVTGQAQVLSFLAFSVAAVMGQARPRNVAWYMVTSSECCMVHGNFVAGDDKTTCKYHVIRAAQAAVDMHT